MDIKGVVFQNEEEAKNSIISNIEKRIKSGEDKTEAGINVADSIAIGIITEEVKLIKKKNAEEILSAIVHILIVALIVYNLIKLAGQKWGVFSFSAKLATVTLLILVIIFISVIALKSFLSLCLLIEEHFQLPINVQHIILAKMLQIISTYIGIGFHEICEKMDMQELFQDDDFLDGNGNYIAEKTAGKE